MLFREHRGGLDESMQTLVEVTNMRGLINRCRDILAAYAFEFSDQDVAVQLYGDGPDERINWPATYLVTIDGFGVIGMTDSVVDEINIEKGKYRIYERKQSEPPS